MKIHHIAIWTFHLEKLREFYTRYFNGTSNEKYINSTITHNGILLEYFIL